MTRTLLIALGLTAFSSLWGGELPVEFKAKVVKLIAASAGSPGQVSCKDAVMLAELSKMGVNDHPSAKVAYANSEAEILALKKQGKFILCGKSDLLPAGASVAIVEEGNRPLILFQMANITSSGITLPESVLRTGVKVGK